MGQPRLLVNPAYSYGPIVPSFRSLHPNHYPPPTFPIFQEPIPHHTCTLGDLFYCLSTIESSTIPPSSPPTSTPPPILVESSATSTSTSNRKYTTNSYLRDNNAGLHTFFTMTAQSLPATLAEAKPTTPLGRFLSAFVVDSKKLHALTAEFEATFRQLAAESQNQFLPTPISSTLLSPIGDLGKREACMTRYVLSNPCSTTFTHPCRRSERAHSSFIISRSFPVCAMLL